MLTVLLERNLAVRTVCFWDGILGGERYFYSSAKGSWITICHSEI